MLSIHGSETVWVEVTKSEHEHGGAGWEFGTCLWSPATDARGGDRYRVIREVKRGDRVLHFNHMTVPGAGKDSFLTGESTVAEPAVVTRDEPPKGGELRKEIFEFRPRNYPLATYGSTLRVAQGMYLARATQSFIKVVSDALGIEVSSSGSPLQAHEEYSEGQRRSRESFFFARTTLYSPNKRKSFMDSPAKRAASGSLNGMEASDKTTSSATT
jgi:hypothetical protein